MIFLFLDLILIHFIFIIYRDRALNPEELMNLFATCPNIPWGKQMFLGVQATEKGWITYSGFICNWVLTTLLDVNKTMEYMAYLGYPISEEKNQTAAISGILIFELIAKPL